MGEGCRGDRYSNERSNDPTHSVNNSTDQP